MKAHRWALQAAVLAALLAVSTVAQYPAVSFRNTASYGANIPRTMHLINSSTAENRNTVRIQVYGQSHSKQEWSQWLGIWLRETWPDVDFVFKNTSIGGCASECLIKSTLFEFREFYPDLLIFHVGAQSEWSYDQICEEARQHTACELMLWTDYNPNGGTWGVNIIRGTGADLDAEMVEAYVQFGEYIDDNAGVTIDDLSDGHLTDHGNWLMCELMKAHFVYRSGDDPDPDGLVKTYYAGRDFSFVGDELTFRFAGNRIDLVTDPTALSGAIGADVAIDGAAPSTNRNCYVATRPNGHLAVDWMAPGTIDWSKDWPWYCGGLYRVTWNATPVVETWTATLTSVNTSSNTFSFSVSGSVTGADGSGSNASGFTSTSGRVIIQNPQDWVLPTSDWWIGDYATDWFTDGYTVSWDIEARHVDTYTPPAAVDSDREHVVTLAQGLANEDHTLTLTRRGTGTVPIKALRVYRPYWGRAATTVPDPVAVTQPVAQSIQRVRTPARGLSRYSLHGRRLQPSVQPSTAHTSAVGVVVRDNGRRVRVEME